MLKERGTNSRFKREREKRPRFIGEPFVRGERNSFIRGVLLVLFFMLVVLSSVVELRAMISSRIEGVVVDKATGKPIAGAEVILYVYQGYASFSTSRGITDEKGYFKMDDLREGKYFISCSKPGYETYSSVSLIGEPDYEKKLSLFYLKEGEIKYFKIGMVPGGSIRIEIKRRDKNGIRGFEDLGVLISKKLYYKSRKKYLYHNTAQVKTDKEGIAVVNGLTPGGIYNVSVSGMGYYGFPDFDKDVTVQKGKTVVVKHLFDFISKTGVKGKVNFKNNEKISYCSVVLFPLEGTGSYSRKSLKDSFNYFFRDIKEGKYLLKVYVVYKSGVEKRRNISIEVKKGETKTVNIDF